MQSAGERRALYGCMLGGHAEWATVYVSDLQILPLLCEARLLIVRSTGDCFSLLVVVLHGPLIYAWSAHCSFGSGNTVAAASVQWSPMRPAADRGTHQPGMPSPIPLVPSRSGSGAVHDSIPVSHADSCWHRLLTAPNRLANPRTDTPPPAVPMHTCSRGPSWLCLLVHGVAR